MPYNVISSHMNEKRETQAESLKGAVRIGKTVEEQGHTNVEVVNRQGTKWPLKYAEMQLGSVSVESV